MALNLPNRKQRSIQPLLAIIAVIAMPALLSAELQAPPLVARIFPILSNHYTGAVQLAISLLLIVIGIAVWWSGSHAVVRRLIYVYATLATVVLIVSLFGLVLTLSVYTAAQATLLLKDAFVVWAMTVLAFSLWYWLIDSGWPEAMSGAEEDRHDFVFPQQTQEINGWHAWAPSYLDYLHLAFNTSTAFSPTDVLPLSHRAKVLMMIQSSLSLVVVATIAARAINILAG
ncbi:MAG: DUF1345 domain-containing protein [Anaerolineales bacterium]|nr:DUF1345 domain-containing protein [Anaerolineales bacterium]